MHGHSLGGTVSWIFSVCLGAVWLSRIVIVWLNRKSVADISAPEYGVSTKIPTPPNEGGMGHPDLHPDPHT